MRLHERVAKELHKAGGQVFLVGGAVRDSLLGREPKDFDLEVHLLGLDEVAAVLSKFGSSSQVGKSFGVFVVSEKSADGSVVDVEVALPRSERPGKSGRQSDFAVQVDPFMGPREAARRRDLSVNALMLDMHSGELLDFFGGVEDLEQGVLRHVSEKFSEDPLRVLRVAQFAGRFGFSVAPELEAVCASLAHLLSVDKVVAPERRLDELVKLLVKSKRPSDGLRFLERVGALAHVLPAVAVLRRVPQDARFHPEGDALEHSFLVVDAARKLSDDPVVLLAALLHDSGKGLVSVVDGDRVSSHGHEVVSAALVEDALGRMKAPKALVRQVAVLCREHMVPLHSDVSDRVARRLLVRLGDVDHVKLALLVQADVSGRGRFEPLPAKAVDLFSRMDRLVSSKAVEPVLMGRHLLALGLRPGPRFGVLLKAAFDAQLDGDVDSVDSALDFLRSKGLLDV